MGEKMSTREVATILGISERSVQLYAKHGKLLSTKDEKGRNRFDRREVEKLREQLRVVGEIAKDDSRTLKTYDPETHILIDRKDHSEHTQRHEGLLIKLGQLEAENRMFRKQLEDMSIRNTPEPIEAHQVETIKEDPPAEERKPSIEEPPQDVPQQSPPHPQHGSQEGVDQLQENWRKFVHAPASIGPVDDPRPFWTAPMVEVPKSAWWKRLLGR